MIHLDYRDARPIYTQIIDGFKEQISTGVLQSGEKLPSVRELAGELAINPNTIQRAYAELEAEGYVVSVTGKGSFVAEGDTQNDARKAELTGKLKPILEELKNLGMSREELLQLWEGEKSSC